VDPIEALVIDFHHVTGLDSAACAALLKLGLLSETGDFRIAFSSVAEKDADTMRKWGLGEGQRPCIRFFPSLAAALEGAEDDVLVLHGARATGEVPLLRRLVDNQVSRASDLLGWMERIEASAGQVLIRAGASDGDIYFIESGRVDVQLNTPGMKPTLLRSLCSGAIVGEAARYLGRRRTADVVVHAPSVIWRLSENAIDRIEAEDRDLAAQLHALMARSLAEKVEKTNGLLSATLA
jgi:SulP family sulfate permease